MSLFGILTSPVMTDVVHAVSWLVHLFGHAQGKA
jgi:hypothetical protein